ncbi:MAG: Fe(3+) ABC transporter substrate-binding protein [Litorivicinaceae bacterium]
MMRLHGVSLGLAVLLSQTVLAAEVNVYSARQESLIQPLLEEFTAQTGIAVNLIAGNGNELLKRIQTEGIASPADLFITVDAGNLHAAKEAGVAQSIQSAVLNQRIPAQLRDSDNQWVGLTLRARPIFYAKDRVSPAELSTYAALTDPKWKGRVCIRSSGNIYNQSLVAAMIQHQGVDATRTWATDFVKNFARKPAGGDTDQLRAVAAGQCDIAIANTYYFGRLADSAKPEDRAVYEALGVFWPDQEGNGVHVNVSGAVLAKHAKNTAEAIQLLEFMVSDQAQAHYARINHEYPVVLGAPVSDTIAAFGTFKADELTLTALGVNNRRAVQLMDQAGWQ